MNINFIESNISSGVGLATIDCVYFDSKKNSEYPDRMKAFIMLHEMGHALRIKKFGEQWVLKQLSLTDLDEFCKSIIREEILADRFARLAFYRLTNTTYPIELTQRLHLPSVQKVYKEKIETYFGLIRNRETYDNMVNASIGK